tara:strand:- start:397 stop:570 length:174 start_codon:yes stop_codon:yes gene_type:complete
MDKSEILIQFMNLEKTFFESNIEIKSFISNIFDDQIEMIIRMNKLEKKIEKLENKNG